MWVLWEYGVDWFAGRHVTIFLLKKLCPCRRGQITTVQLWC